MDAIEAVAEVWASIDGKLEKFRDERAIVNGPFATSMIVKDGHYAGYMVEAEEMIDRLRARGFDVTPIRSATVTVLRPTSEPHSPASENIPPESR
jgi:hypothetical protein